MPKLDPLFRRFAPEITVKVRPEAFTFSTRNFSVELPTRVHVSEDHGSYRITPIGKEVAHQTQTTIVDFFSPTVVLPWKADKLELLVAFCRAAISKHLPKSHSVMRPVVIIEGSSSLDNLLHGWQDSLLRMAFESCGASDVEFR